jgi:hypothetical protein
MTDDLHDPVRGRAVGVATAARHNGYHEHDELDLPRRAAKAYRTAMHRFTDASYREVWCAHLDVNEIFRGFADPLTNKDRSRSTAPPVEQLRGDASRCGWTLERAHTTSGDVVTSGKEYEAPARSVPGP